MATQFTLPPDCKAVTMDGDGTRYKADSTGHITVDNPAHAAKIATNGSRYIHQRITGFTSLPGRKCSCGFEAHAFSSTCPRCGTPLREN